MGFVAINMEEVVEPKPAPAGRYNVQIATAEVVETGQNSKNPGRPQYRVSFGFPDNPEVPNFTKYFPIPHPDDAPNSAQFKALLLKRLMVLFQLPIRADGFDIEGTAMALVGQTANVEITLTEPNDNDDVFNDIKIPRLPGEASGRGTPPRGGRR